MKILSKYYSKLQKLRSLAFPKFQVLQVAFYFWVVYGVRCDGALGGMCRRVCLTAQHTTISTRLKKVYGFQGSKIFLEPPKQKKINFLKNPNSVICLNMGCGQGSGPSHPDGVRLFGVVHKTHFLLWHPVQELLKIEKLKLIQNLELLVSQISNVHIYLIMFNFLNFYNRVEPIKYYIMNPIKNKIQKIYKLTYQEGRLIDRWVVTRRTNSLVYKLWMLLM